MKNLTITTCILLLLSSRAFAQERFSSWQVEISYDYMMHGDPLGVQVLYADASEVIIGNNEKNSFYLAVTRLTNLKGRFSFRHGLSLSDKGYRQEYLFINPNTGVFWRWNAQQQLYYAGVPIILSYNTLTQNKRLSGFAEVGLLPEVLVAQNNLTEIPEAELVAYDMRPFGLSGTVNAGLQFRMNESLTLIAGPQLRYSFFNYDKDSTVGNSSITREASYRPFSIGFAVGLRF